METGNCLCVKFDVQQGPNVTATGFVVSQLYDVDEPNLVCSQ